MTAIEELAFNASAAAWEATKKACAAAGVKPQPAANAEWEEAKAWLLGKMKQPQPLTVNAGPDDGADVRAMTAGLSLNLSEVAASQSGRHFSPPWPADDQQWQRLDDNARATRAALGLPEEVPPLDETPESFALRQHRRKLGRQAPEAAYNAALTLNHRAQAAAMDAPEAGEADLSRLLGPTTEMIINALPNEYASGDAIDRAFGLGSHRPTANVEFFPGLVANDASDEDLLMVKPVDWATVAASQRAGHR